VILESGKDFVYTNIEMVEQPPAPVEKKSKK
jgi:hypothetical protein